MLRIRVGEDGEIRLSGRFDASQVETAEAHFDKITKSCTVNFAELDYISSAGLGILLGTQKRLSESGNKLKLINLNKHVRDVFRYAGFDKVFEIE